jgi:hypothetical protein
VRFDRPGLDVPASVWFRFPEAYRPHLNEDADPFVVAMMMPAMLLGENVVVEGRVSPRLAHGLREYVTAYAQWWPGKIAPVDVSYAEVSAGAPRAARGVVACAFSGGVDSLYTVWRHMPGNETVPGFHITHALMINGFNFDMDLENTREFQRLVDVYRPMLERRGIELVVSRQNTEVFLEAANKAASKSPTREGGVVSAALALGGLCERIYISGSGTYRHEDNFPKGWHPSALHLLSSNATEMMFDGGDASRTEKTVALSKWEDTYATLRVCWRPTVFNDATGRMENCCRCPKCVRTMVTLDAVGALSKYETFPLPLERRIIRAAHFVSTSEKKFYFDLLRLARSVGRNDLVRDLRSARLRSRLSAAVRHRLLRRPKPRH